LATTTPSTAGRLRPRPGVNAIASWESTTGLAQAARRSVLALVEAGVPVALVDYDYGAPRAPHRLPAQLRDLPRGRPYEVDLCFLNVNELHVVPEAFLRPEPQARPVVVSWFWELSCLPPDLVRETRRVDEIWVASNFVAEVFERHATCPVAVVPCIVGTGADESGADEREAVKTGAGGALGQAAGTRRALGARRDLGLPVDRFLVLSSFDASSTIARKNPFGAVEAYRRAFSPAERARSVHLVVKTINLAALPEAFLALSRAVSDVGGTLLDTEMSDSQLAGLTAACDVYLSLHRAEGFGLGIAEAMFAGRPVVATAYSGPSDFLDVAAGCPVGYRTCAVDAGELRFNPAARNVYVAGETWAEPDVGEAARRLRMLYEHPRVRARLGEAAAAVARERFSSATVGRQMVERLEAVVARGVTARGATPGAPANGARAGRT
jgi:glycosyltransferase involved in cell wall biosynthesis